MTFLVHREDYSPPRYWVDSVDLDITLELEASRVCAELAIRRSEGALLSEPLVLDGLGLRLLDIRIDGLQVAPERYVLTASELTIRDLPSAFTLSTVVEFDPSANLSGLGLFLLQGKLATQCEAEGFRRLTFFPDRPDILSKYRVRIEADRASFPVLLSNGNRVDFGAGGEGRHWAIWEDPYPKPCYIFAIVAGDFEHIHAEFVTKSGRPVTVSIYADAALIGNCGFALEAVQRALTWDEITFGLEYDLDVYNIVALGGWAGAMENKGLNLFGASGIVADPSISTDDDFITIERIIGHEQFHNWTGNRVTCRDWFQLALKEGLTRYRDQFFMESRLGSGAWRIEIVKALRRNQFPEDDGPAAHPVRPDAYADIDNFYTNTVYDKGAELVRMIATLVGPQSFREGLSLYLARHDGQAVTIEDFLAAMERASSRDLLQFSRWYAQAGRPRVTASGSYDPQERAYTLTLSQETRCPAGETESAPLHIPIAVGLLSRAGESLASERVLELTRSRQTFTFQQVDEEPVASLLREFSAPVTLISEREADALATLAAHDPDPFARWDAAQTLGIMTLRTMAADPGMGTPEPFMAMFAAVLNDQATDSFLLAQLLAVPDEPVLSEGLAYIPLDQHMAARQRLRASLAKTFKAALQSRYEALARPGLGSADFLAMGRRKLRNTCLDLLTSLETTEAAELCLIQVQHSDNMTDAFEALTSLVHLNLPQRELALDWFVHRWRDQPTVIDKWFNAQALSRAPGAIDSILALEGHPSFDARNTARAMAFYGGFFRQNRVTFHDLSGKGYEFLADRLLTMDASGRGGSFWVMPQINQWRRYDLARQTSMKAALDRVAGTSGISVGLRETLEAALR